MNRIVMVALLIFAMKASDNDLVELARSGNIQEDAPIKASAEVTVNATPEKVWALLTDVNSWPKWQPDIRKTQVSGPLQFGTSFLWSAGTDIQSRIELVQPFAQLAWTGTAFNARAVHVWKLQRLPGNQTLVKTNESMQGFLLTLFYSSAKLQDSDQRWLNYLKAAAER